MDRKRSFQARFERAKTPMGAVPISVIMGFDYPLGDTEQSGRGEATSSYSYKPSYSTGCSSDYIPGYSPGYTSSLNNNYMNSNMLKRIPRPSTQISTAPISAYRTPGQREYQCRAITEVGDLVCLTISRICSDFGLAILIHLYLLTATDTLIICIRVLINSYCCYLKVVFVVVFTILS